MVTRKSTTQLLEKLRSIMQDVKYVQEPLQAYIVPWNDAHNSEYVADCDQQRAYISGFTGSAGTAIVTLNDARLWTDGRYYLQASQELDSNWTLMKESIPTTPSIDSWLSKNLPRGSRVGVDPTVITHSRWKPLSERLSTSGSSLVAIKENLVNLIWPDRPPRPNNPIHHLEDKFNGKSVSEKLTEIRSAMDGAKASTLVLTALDEIAWFFNLRGSDIEYCPVFFSYAVITNESVALFTGFDCSDGGGKLDVKSLEYLRQQIPNIEILPYMNVYDYVAERNNQCGKIWMSSQAPHSLALLASESKLLIQITPVALMKAIKNPTEAEGMRACHIRDGAALVRFFCWLEKAIASGEKVTEISAADRLEKFRSEQKHFVGLSFPTITSSGEHAAIIHYHVTEESDKEITANEVYLCDSGAQYLDGTTDVTRTVHMGEPTDYQKDCFTRVLKGQLSVGCALFPERIKGNCLDSFARRALWDVGLDYAHGTGHGIGHYLNVHEGPMGISWRVYPEDPGLQPGMFLSNEPGYYEDGKFGIRLENIVHIVRADPPNKFDDKKFLTMETVTMCPIQKKMIKKELLTEKEIKILNDYHMEVREKLTPLITMSNDNDALTWLVRETEPL